MVMMLIELVKPLQSYMGIKNYWGEKSVSSLLGRRKYERCKKLVPLWNSWISFCKKDLCITRVSVEGKMGFLAIGAYKSCQPILVSTILGRLC